MNCPQCNGTGKKKYPNKRLKQTCHYCGGSKKVEITDHTKGSKPPE